MIRRLFRKRDSFGDLLTDAASGRLDADGLRRLDELAAHSAERQAARDETLALAGLLRSQPMVPVPRSFTLSVPPEPRRAPALPRPIQAMTAAAAIALVALIAVDFATVGPGGAPATAPYAAAIEGSRGDASPTTESAGASSDAPVAASRSEAAPSATREPEAGSGQPSDSADAQAPIGAVPAESESAATRGWRALDWAVAAVGLATAALALAHLTAAWLARRRL
ncbi:MAG: hypothetical protein J4F32_03385 [Dehalococcoidia bacterium]|nr:hypothetical protein [Dehalococcoidia bacterium]